ncbi:hypothetical protein PO587_35065 [Streptomyces gilvifuscus]|uniref:Uncharacterized protein n=1 Tax=Streptomyces gilvifuscus TaxID=1550617 RepID=A0ABT5G4D2_9ACTN|nr:hypothetical protein [Streptomyces gilvifuscus]MDC2959660.1 hypothetical protein [Streptomyces gilvifuscus]
MSGSWRRSRQKQDGGDDEAADGHGVEQDGDGQAESELLEMRSSLRTKAKLGARDGSQAVVMAHEYRRVSPGRLTD